MLRILDVLESHKCVILGNGDVVVVFRKARRVPAPTENKNKKTHTKKTSYSSFSKPTRHLVQQAQDKNGDTNGCTDEVSAALSPSLSLSLSLSHARNTRDVRASTRDSRVGKEHLTSRIPHACTSWPPCAACRSAEMASETRPSSAHRTRSIARL